MIPIWLHIPGIFYYIYKTNLLNKCVLSNNESEIYFIV